MEGRRGKGRGRGEGAKKIEESQNSRKYFKDDNFLRYGRKLQLWVEDGRQKITERTATPSR